MKASNDEEITFVVAVEKKLATDALTSISDLGHRRAALDTFYHNAKAPLLAGIAALRGARIVNLLEGTNMLIVAASAETWRKVLAKHSILNAADVMVRTNETRYVTLDRRAGHGSGR